MTKEKSEVQEKCMCESNKFIPFFIIVGFLGSVILAGWLIFTISNSTSDFFTTSKDTNAKVSEILERLDRIEIRENSSSMIRLN